MLSGKRFKNSSIILSLDEDSPMKKLVLTVALDANTTIDDDEEDKPKENVSSQYDNCTHGDHMDYMCVVALITGGGVSGILSSQLGWGQEDQEARDSGGQPSRDHPGRQLGERVQVCWSWG